MVMVMVMVLATACRSGRDSVESLDECVAAESAAPATRRLFDGIPPPVRHAVEAVLGDTARIKQVTRSDRFEAISATKLEVEVTPTGAIVQTEVTLPTTSLPLPVARAAATKGTPTEAVIVLTADGLVFEVGVTTATGKFEYSIDPMGHIIDELDESRDGDGEDP